jgi:hypothetical protein
VLTRLRRALPQLPESRPLLEDPNYDADVE